MGSDTSTPSGETPFAAVTRTRISEPTSPWLSRYVSAVAPLTGVHESTVVEVQRSHWSVYASVSEGNADQEPVEAARVKPDWAVPVIFGFAFGSGSPFSRCERTGAPTTTSESGVVSVTVPSEFVTVTTARTREPRSASESGYWLVPPHGAAEVHVFAPDGDRVTGSGGSALTGTQSPPRAGQRCHWCVIVSGAAPRALKPLHSPEVAVSALTVLPVPRAAVPVSAGRPFGAAARLTGPACTTAVTRLSRWTLVPGLFEALATSFSVDPRSASVTTYGHEPAGLVCRYASGPVVTPGAYEGAGLTATQLRPATLQRNHTGVSVGAGLANQVPARPWSVSPTLGFPSLFGSTIDGRGVAASLCPWYGGDCRTAAVRSRRRPRSGSTPFAPSPRRGGTSRRRPAEGCTRQSSLRRSRRTRPGLRTHNAATDR